MVYAGMAIVLLVLLRQSSLGGNGGRLVFKHYEYNVLKSIRLPEKCGSVSWGWYFVRQFPEKPGN